MRVTKRRKFQPPHSRPVFFFADEAHAFSNEYDADYQAVCRSQGVCCVRLTQNIPNFIRSYGGGTMAELISDAIFATLCTKVLLRNSDPTTNAWASRLIAKDTVNRTSLSNSASAGSESHNTSLSPVEEPSCPEKNFLGLKSGGPAHNYTVEAIIFQSGRLFNGNRWFVGSFSQKP
jgi:TraM recognition site of TraD and TraG